MNSLLSAGIVSLVLAATDCWGFQGANATPDPKLAAQGYALLKQYCVRCHGVNFEAPDLNVMDRERLVAGRGSGKTNYVVPGNAKQSLIWQRLGVEADMPPEDAAQPSAAEKALLEKWIESGFAFPAREKRPFITVAQMLTGLRDDLRKTPAADRPYRRYFTLTHLYNNPSVTEDELRLYQAALSKTANSLSWKQQIAVPEPIDREGTVFRVDLRDYDWDQRGQWQRLLKAYPYGLKHDEAPAGLREIAQEVYETSGADLPYLRADWFIATANRPPLYYALLDLPDNAGQLEALLKVDVKADFLRNRLARAAFTTSGVSGQNRLVDRHPAAYGHYWKSYDFKTNDGPGNLLQFPLGPDFKDHPHPKQAFVHDGGEILFSLPNGLQGYYLTDGQDRRIDVGPVEVVSDALKTSGTPAIVNALSCMACHKHGVIPLTDSVRAGAAVFGAAKLKVEQLYPTQRDLETLLAKDEARYLAALEESTGRFLKVGADAGKNLKEFPEPVGAIARLYLKDLGPLEAASELGLADPQTLQTLIQGNTKLRSLGLGPLVAGHRIKRDAWQSLERFLSLFQSTCLELDLGTPHRPL